MLVWHVKNAGQYVMVVWNFVKFYVKTQQTLFQKCHGYLSHLSGFDITMGRWGWTGTLSFSQSFIVNASIKLNWHVSQPIGAHFAFRYRIQPIRRLVGWDHDQEHSPAQFLILPSSIGNGSGKRKAESPKAVAPTTAGPGYHLAPGNIAESHRRQKPLPTSSNHEQRGRDTTTAAAACCRWGEPIQPGSRCFRGG